jgi:hypothetical protein
MTKQATIARDIMSMTKKDDNEQMPLVNSSNETDARIRKQPGKKKPNELHGTKVTPLVQRNTLLRVDVTPFVGIYLTLIALDQAEYNDRTGQWMISRCGLSTCQQQRSLQLDTFFSRISCCEWNDRFRNRSSHSFERNGGGQLP